MSNNDELIAQFTEITGATAESAKFYLESSNWALQDALSNYLTNAADGDDVNDIEPNDDDDSILMPPTNSNRTGSSQQTDEPSTAKPNKKSGSSRTTRPKIATLHNMSQNSSSDEEGQAFYAGGSERSGQQVLGPPKRKNFSEKLTDMFRQAHEQAHEHPAPSTSSSGASWGVGLRLGQTEDDHSVVNAGAKNDSRKAQSVVLKLWSQGFSINDGELRLYDDPENKEFLETVMRGEIPSELIEMGSMVSVDVEDHRQEDFKRKVKKVQTFKGSGQTLGSPAPNVVETNAVDAPEDGSSNEDNESKAKEQLNVKTGEPVTQLQIRLADGSRITSQFNLTHTVGDIRQFIETARPQYAHRTFILVSSFPTREIDDDTATIEKAGLKNAAIMQRFK
ncbi:NSFL1 cofactor p47 [Episyrphus balteatus]|uniref:NSFL1 cofactor p47 n=1 Tax=Episyrphus balteatus TaxID=286459 RepID=UPI00248634CC|nr:NSFL1 cofactor p47 [Episyrphus balteatus]